MTSEGPIYVYGVVAADASISPPAEGVAGGAPRLVQSDGLAALVSDVPSAELRVRRRDLQAHLRALEETFEQTAILPCRFGTVLASEEVVRRELLDARRDELRGLLDRLGGCAQMNVKAVYDEPEVVREVVAADPQIAQASARARALGDAGHFANVRVGEVVAGQIAARRQADAQRIYERLAGVAREVVAEAKEEPLLIIQASCLVERRNLQRFDSEVESLAAASAPSTRFELVGPLPPTAFVSLEQGA